MCVCIHVSEYLGNREAIQTQPSNQENGWKEKRQRWSPGFASLWRGLACSSDLKQISFRLQRKSGVINLARWNSVFVNTSLLLRLGDNMQCQICSFTTLLLKTNHTTLDNRLKGPRGPILSPLKKKQHCWHYSLFLRKKIRAIILKMLFLTLAPFFYRCCACLFFFFHCQQFHIKQKRMNMFIQTNDYSSPEIN